jgi:hypothetical protein
MHDDLVYHYSKHPLISCPRMHREAIDKIARRGPTPEEQKRINEYARAKKARDERAHAGAEVIEVGGE